MFLKLTLREGGITGSPLASIALLRDHAFAPLLLTHSKIVADLVDALQGCDLVLTASLAASLPLLTVLLDLSDPSGVEIFGEVTKPHKIRLMLN